MIDLDVVDIIKSGESVLEKGNFKKARSKFLEALSLVPEDPQLHNRLGMLEMSQGNPEKAKTYYSKACELAPDVSRYHMRLGDSFQRLGKFEDAIHSYARSLELEPKNAPAWNNRGFANFNINRWNEALRCYDESMKSDSSYAVAWYNYGYTLQLSGRLNDSKDYYQKAVELDPEDKMKKYDEGEGPAAHPNSRFTVSAKNNASYSRLAESPEGVPISAIVFGGRRKELAPLVYEAKSWQHGVLIGASVASETTAAAIGDVGVIRRDPMAMKPFCGYNFADYWQHWLSFSDRTKKLPKIFHVNWFRQDKLGKFLWPGFGENLRVLRWIIDRCENQVDAQDTAIGYLPHTKDINTDDLDISNETMKELLSVKKESWIEEMKSVGKYLQSYGERLPNALLKNQEKVLKMLMD